MRCQQPFARVCPRATLCSTTPAQHAAARSTEPVSSQRARFAGSQYSDARFQHWQHISTRSQLSSHGGSRLRSCSQLDTCTSSLSTRAGRHSIDNSAHSFGDQDKLVELIAAGSLSEAVSVCLTHLSTDCPEVAHWLRFFRHPHVPTALVANSNSFAGGSHTALPATIPEALRPLFQHARGVERPLEPSVVYGLVDALGQAGLTFEGLVLAVCYAAATCSHTAPTAPSRSHPRGSHTLSPEVEKCLLSAMTRLCNVTGTYAVGERAHHTSATACFAGGEAAFFTSYPSTDSSASTTSSAGSITPTTTAPMLPQTACMYVIGQLMDHGMHPSHTFLSLLCSRLPLPTTSHTLASLQAEDAIVAMLRRVMRANAPHTVMPLLFHGTKHLVQSGRHLVACIELYRDAMWLGAGLDTFGILRLIQLFGHLRAPEAALSLFDAYNAFQLQITQEIQIGQEGTPSSSTFLPFCRKVASPPVAAHDMRPFVHSLSLRSMHARAQRRHSAWIARGDGTITSSSYTPASRNSAEKAVDACSDASSESRVQIGRRQHTLSRYALYGGHIHEVPGLSHPLSITFDGLSLVRLSRSIVEWQMEHAASYTAHYTHEANLHTKLVQATLTALTSRTTPAASVDHVSTATRLVNSLTSMGFAVDDSLMDPVLRLGALHSNPSQVARTVTSLATAPQSRVSMQTLTSVLSALLKTATPTNDAVLSSTTISTLMFQLAGWQSVPAATAAAQWLKAFPAHTLHDPAVQAMLQQLRHCSHDVDVDVFVPPWLLPTPPHQQSPAVALLPSATRRPAVAIDAVAMAVLMRVLAAADRRAAVCNLAVSLMHSMPENAQSIPQAGAKSPQQHLPAVEEPTRILHADIVSQAVTALRQCTDAMTAFHFSSSVLAPTLQLPLTTGAGGVHSRVAMRCHLYIQLMQLCGDVVRAGAVGEAVVFARSLHRLAVQQTPLLAHSDTAAASGIQGVRAPYLNLSTIDSGSMQFSERSLAAFLRVMWLPWQLCMAPSQLCTMGEHALLSESKMHRSLGSSLGSSQHVSEHVRHVNDPLVVMKQQQAVVAGVLAEEVMAYLCEQVLCRGVPCGQEAGHAALLLLVALAASGDGNSTVGAVNTAPHTQRTNGRSTTSSSIGLSGTSTAHVLQQLLLPAAGPTRQRTVREWGRASASFAQLTQQCNLHVNSGRVQARNSRAVVTREDMPSSVAAFWNDTSAASSAYEAAVSELVHVLELHTPSGRQQFAVRLRQLVSVAGSKQ